MRVFCAAAMIAMLAGPAAAQQQAVPRYGDVAKPKTPQELEAERAAEQSYKRSLGNIPDKGPTDPWGTVRSESPPKAATKAAAKTAASPKAKAQAKTGGAPN